jgi:hypothetical protein
MPEKLFADSGFFDLQLKCQPGRASVPQRDKMRAIQGRFWQVSGKSPRAARIGLSRNLESQQGYCRKPGTAIRF